MSAGFGSGLRSDQLFGFRMGPAIPAPLPHSVSSSTPAVYIVSSWTTLVHIVYSSTTLVHIGSSNNALVQPVQDGLGLYPDPNHQCFILQVYLRFLYLEWWWVWLLPGGGVVLFLSKLSACTWSIAFLWWRVSTSAIFTISASPGLYTMKRQRQWKR